MRILCLILLLTGLHSCKNTNKSGNYDSDSKGSPKFVIQEEIHNFGTVQAGEVLSYSFRFKNEGTGDLLIDSATVECRCLKITFPHEPVKGGEYSYIEVLFNSAGEVGNLLKQIQIFTNADGEARNLLITANVENEMINLYN